MHWDNLKYFIATARAGSLTVAANILHTSPATLSRKLVALERECGAALFTRTHAGYGLTRDGEALLARGVGIEEAFMALEHSLPGSKEEISGQVLIATSENLAHLILLPALVHFRLTYPLIDIEFHTGVQQIALHGREADIAVRLSLPSAGNFKVRVVGCQAHALYANHVLANDARHAEIGIVGWSEGFADLPIARAANTHNYWRCNGVRLNSLQGHVAAARVGLGLAYLPCFVGDFSGELVRVDGPAGLLSQSIYLVLHNDAIETRRVRVVADFIIDTLRNAAPRLLGEAGPASGSYERV
jgi:DNA-binding transcriptional LysR family regulator